MIVLVTRQQESGSSRLAQWRFVYGAMCAMLSSSAMCFVVQG